MNDTDVEENIFFTPEYNNSDQLTELQKKLINTISSSQLDLVQSTIEQIPDEDIDFYWSIGGTTTHPITLLMALHARNTQEKIANNIIQLIKSILNKIKIFTLSDNIYPFLSNKNYHDNSVKIIGMHPLHNCLNNKDFYCLFEIMLEKTFSETVLCGAIIKGLNNNIPDDMLHKMLDKIENYDINLDCNGFPVDIDDPFSEGSVKNMLFYFERWDTILRMASMGHSFDNNINVDESTYIPMIWCAVLQNKWDIVAALLTVDNLNSKIDIGIMSPVLSELIKMVAPKSVIDKMTELNIGYNNKELDKKESLEHTFFMCFFGMFDKIIDAINAGFDPHSKVTAGPMQGHNLVRLACISRFGDSEKLYDFLDFCIDKKIDIDCYLTEGEFAGTNALWDAISEDKLDLAEYLLERGACPHAALYEDNSVETSCYLAAVYKQYELCKKLINKGVDPNIFQGLKNIGNNSVLFKVILDNNFDMVQFLTNKKANLNLLSRSGFGPETALHACVIQGECFDIFSYLLKNGANPNIYHCHRLLFYIFNSNIANKHVWALEAVKYGADLSCPGEDLHFFREAYQVNPTYAALSLVYLFLNCGQNKPNDYNSLSNQEKNIYDKVKNVFNIVVQSTLFTWKKLNNDSQDSPPMSSKLPFELRCQIVNLCFTYHLQQELAEILPIPHTSMSLWLEASKDITKVLDAITDADNKACNVIFARMIVAARDNPNLIYGPDAVNLAQNKKSWNTRLFKQFCEVVHENGLEQDLSYAQREEISYRIKNYTPCKSARINSDQADFTWLFKFGMYGVDQLHINQLFKEEKLNNKFNNRLKSEPLLKNKV